MNKHDLLKTCQSSTIIFFSICLLCKSVTNFVGYDGDGVDTCSDINECESGVNSCHSNAVCANTDGSYTCSCDKEGYRGNGKDECDGI